jgi:GNAT superfamily N-acetyltransferase
MADFLRETPMQNPILGLLADRLKKAQEFGAKPFGYENPPVEMLMNLLGIPAVQQTMERMAYGEPLTTGRGMTTKPRPEAVEAALTVAPVAGLLAKTTKGLPVGASIKSIDDIVAKYPDVTIDASVGKKDINLSRIVVPKEMRNQGVGTQVMSDLSEYADSIGKRITLTPSDSFGGSVPKLKSFYKELGFVENKGKNKDFSTRETMYREPQAVDVPPSYPQQEALDTAQRNAALPIEEGGLGLPKDNTPEMRAAAMSMEKRGFHETEGKNIEQGLLNFDTRRVGAAASDEQTPYAMFIKPSSQGIGIAKNQPAQMPLYVKSNLTDENILRSFDDRAQLQQYLNQFPEIKEATKAVRDLDNQMANYMEELTKKADALDAQGKTAEADKILNAMANDSPLMKQFDERLNELSAVAKEKITQHFQEQNIGTVGLINDQGAFGRKTITEMVLNPAENVRSAYAAFDPFRRNTETALAKGVAPPDLLAGVLPLGLLADEDQRKKLYELMPSLLGE